MKTALAFLSLCACAGAPAVPPPRALEDGERCEVVLVERSGMRARARREICVACDGPSGTCAVRVDGASATLDMHAEWRMRSLELVRTNVFLLEHDEGECGPMYLPVCFDLDARARLGAEPFGACSQLRELRTTEDGHLELSFETPAPPADPPLRYSFDPARCAVRAADDDQEHTASRRGWRSLR